jgi:hypothetical protein
MKKLLMCLFLLLLTCSTYGQSAKFLEQVLGYRDGRSQFFIPIRIRSESASGDVVAESYALMDYLNATRGIDAAAYKSFILNLQKGKTELEMKDVTVDDRGFLIGKGIKTRTFRLLETNPAFEIILGQGCEDLINHYFGPPLDWTNDKGKSTCREIIGRNGKDLFMRPRYDLSEENNVILALFKLDIPVDVDDMSGSLKIAYSLLK